jgi:Flp pilus assembly protein TadD
MQAMTMRPSLLLIATLLMSGGVLLAQAPCTPPESMKTQLQDNPKAATYTDLGVWFADQKQYACAANAFATSLQMDPNQKDAGHVAFMFGISLYFSGDTKEAITALRETEQVGYNNLELHVILAGALDASHSTKEAEEEWRAALAFDPESTAALDALSNDLIQEDDFAGTIALLDVPRLLGQRSPQQSLNLATAYASTERLDQAASVLRDSLNTSPGSLVLANRLTSILVRLNRKDEAAALLALAVDQHSADSDTATQYLETLMTAYPDMAIEAAHKLLANFPHNSKLLYLSGVIEMNGGNLQQARADLEQSLNMQPNEAKAHEALGVVLAQLKEMTGAKEHFERAIALGDNSPEAKANLARAIEALGPGK